MRAMILAAGMGTRLLPLTKTMPKALVPVAGTPMIHYGLRLLAAHGIRDVMINLHHYGAMIEDALGDGAEFGVRIRYSREEVLLDTGGGIKKAAPFLQEGPFLVVNCDVLAEIDLHRLIRFHSEKKAAATLVLRDDPQIDKYGVIETDREGRICRILSSGTPGERRKMFAGIHVLDPRVFGYMPSPLPFGITRETYPLMLQEGETLLGFDFSGPWFDLGTPDGIRNAEKMISETARGHRSMRTKA